MNNTPEQTKPIFSKCVLNPAQKYCRMHEFFSRIPREAFNMSFGNINDDGVRKVLADMDMRHTIQMYFHCDLNINKASKELFMHRNTLIYRLDKIHRLTNLDLKKFCDAFIFHVLMFKANV
ncbi:MAG: helix-turn-helix domain-containing protein [Firmicutes bacterium]|nr:helix-turn-helix domain-containing protein [Bacillota bacterium]